MVTEGGGQTRRLAARQPGRQPHPGRLLGPHTPHLQTFIK